MKIEKFFNKNGNRDTAGAFNICTSAGNIDGTTEYIEKSEANKYSIDINIGSFTVSSTIEKKKNVCLRRDILTNISDSSIYLKKYFCRFCISTDDALVYTQHSNWINESKGAFQKLVSGICAENYGVRSTAGAAPFISVWDNTCEKGISFNIVPNTAWKIIAERRPVSCYANAAVIELGISDDRLDMEIKPGESIYLPEIIFYDFDNKTDMGCAKLHEYMNSEYPAKNLPVIYNTWFANFDGVNYDLCFSQAKKAAYIGAEYFVIDAGWFGSDDGWSNHIGEWEENLSGAFCGRMKELSDNVRKLGMKFGLWIEAERALAFVPSVKEHPEYYISEDGNYFLDYSNERALEFIESIVFGLIDKYNIEFIKFDFNADCKYDNKNSAFYHYHRGHKKFIDDIHEKYPGIYLENCASGGTRMDLFHAQYMDSVWFSDNQNPYSGTRIIRDTILRMPPSAIERWAAVQSVGGFPAIYSDSGKKTRLVSVAEATWQNISGIDMNYIKTFCTGGPLGITCNLDELTSDDLDEIKNIICEYKKIREFYKSAVCKILISTEYFTVLQYSDTEEKTVFIQVFENYAFQDKITVYPRLEKGRSYLEYSAAELKENGIEIVRNRSADKSDFCNTIILKCID